jgi:hypothetical protein
VKHIAVTYTDNVTHYFPVGLNRPWRIDAPSRCLIIGRGVPRIYVPLDQVRSFHIEEAGTDD